MLTNAIGCPILAFESLLHINTKDKLLCVWFVGYFVVSRNSFCGSQWNLKIDIFVLYSHDSVYSEGVILNRT